MRISTIINISTSTRSASTVIIIPRIVYYREVIPRVRIKGDSSIRHKLMKNKLFQRLRKWIRSNYFNYRR